jgi:hypothetical protein
MFGDLLVEKNLQAFKENCKADNLELNCVLRGVRLTYNIDCKKQKSTQVTLENSYLQKGVIFSSEGYIRKSNILTPRVIEMADLNSNTKIRIRFIKIELPWNGNVKFIPGRGYELIELL